MDPLWSAFVGAVGGICAGGLAVWNAGRLHDATIAEERKRRREDREYAAKLDAFMRASDALANVITGFIALPDHDATQAAESMKSLAILQAAFSRLHFFARIDTLRSLTEFGQTLATKHCEAQLARAEVEVLGAGIDLRQGRIAALNQWNDKIHSEIEVLMAGDADHPGLTSRWKQHSKNLLEISGLHAEIADILDEQMAARERCRDVVVAGLPAIMRASQELLVAARTELGFAIGEERYAQLMADATDFSVRTITTHLQNLRRMMRPN